MIELNNKSKFSKLAEECKTDIQKIDFFNTYQEAFIPIMDNGESSIKEYVSKEIDDAFYVYANMKRLTEHELIELRELAWKNYPRNFKIFLFDFCFLNTNWFNFNFVGWNALDQVSLRGQQVLRDHYLVVVDNMLWILVSVLFALSSFKYEEHNLI